ncbi:MAG TPA: hypothetical protein VIG69_06600 [Candidatus Methylomirabilis sp.]|jgi:hypothetical protein
MQGGSGFLLLGICAGGAALLLGVLYVLHGEVLLGGGIIGGTALFGLSWRWIGRALRKYI